MFEDAIRVLASIVTCILSDFTTEQWRFRQPDGHLYLSQSRNDPIFLIVDQRTRSNF